MSQEQMIQTHEMKGVEETTCCIVGGGPAGMMLALLLARQGIAVTLLEAHMDFDRDFRGDTIHPAVMEILDEIGLASRLLQLKHTEARQFVLQTTTGNAAVDLSRLKTKYPYITIISQARFLDFIAEEARQYTTFKLVMGAQVNELIEEGGAVRGVRYHGQDGWYEVRAALTVGADGRFSRVRKLAGFEPVATSTPMDVLWFRLSRQEGDPNEGAGGRFTTRRIVVLINRLDYWQVGYVIPKGGYQEIRAAGLEVFRQALAQTLPFFANRVDELKEWKQIAVLSVESSRVPRWHRKGLLVIGDAAHVMSPIGGVGINYAIQDAVATANILSGKLKANTVQESDLAKVQQERELPTRVIQRVQVLLQDQIFAKAMKAAPDAPFTFPPFIGWMLSIPFVRTLLARLIAFGLRPAHVQVTQKGQ